MVKCMISIINADNPARAKRAIRYLTIIEQTNRTIRYPTISGAHETNDTISNDNLFTRDNLCEKKSSKTMDVEGKMSISTGTIDTGARAEIRHVDPRFTVGACYALLRAINIHVDLAAISISEASDANGNVSRSVKASVSRKDVNRLVGIPRRFTWQGEVMRIMFSKSHDALDSKGEGAERANATLVSPCGSPSPRKPSKRGHTPGATPNRVTKSKHDMESDVGETGETFLEDEAKDVLPEGHVDLGVPETLLPAVIPNQAT